MAARVQVVIVNWNGEEYLAACLRAVAAQDHDGPLDVLVVDNGSTDGSLALLARDFPQVEVLRSARNNYTAANNLGVARSKGPHALLLNTDAVIEPAAVRLLVAALEADSRAAAAAPLITYPDGRICTTGIVERDDLRWVDRDQGKRLRAFGGTERVWGVSGCCVLVRTDAWREVGGQDEAFHMYYEDVDLALRWQQRGWHCLFVPAARCVHEGHGSIRKATVWKDELGERNRLMVLARSRPECFLRELADSPWIHSAPREQVEALLPLLAQRFRADAGQGLAEIRAVLATARRPRWSLRRRMRKVREALAARFPDRFGW
jgi:GT2 family glycosyltransferase